MKLYPEKLLASFSKGLLPVYLITGDEPLIRQELCDQIRQQARSEGFIERELFHVETGFDWQEIHYSLNSLSLFAEKKIIEVRLNQAKQPEKAAAALAAMSSAGDDILVLLSMPRADGNVQKAKWFKALEGVGAVIQVWSVAPKDLPRWIEQRLRQQGVRIDRDAILALASRVEGNLLAAVQEMDRLVLAAPEKLISLDLVESSVSDHARYDAYQWLDAALMGKAARALRILNGLKTEGVEPLAVTGALIRELRQLLELAETAQQSSVDQALASARVWPKRKALIGAALRRLGRADLEQIHAATRRVDAMVKGAESGDPWDAMTGISMHLCGQVLGLNPSLASGSQQSTPKAG